MNPYQVPPAGSGLGPLCPYAHPEHEDYYVPVDNTENSFETFKRMLGDAARLRDDGRLVVALGWDGCGKTSLLNRCAAWVQGCLGDDCHVVSMGKMSRERETVEERQRNVFQSLIYELGDRELLTPEHRLEMTGALDKHNLNIGYYYVSRYVLKPKNAVLVILLPRTEIREEVENYARWAHPNLVFLAESRMSDAVIAHWPVIQQVHNPSLPIRLDVGTLTENDGWAFVQARKGDRTDALGYPFVAEETIRRVTAQRELSIGELHDLLHGVYQELLENGAMWRSRSTGLMGEVTFEDLLSFYFRRLGRQR
ncbi:hypothetical protein [Lentzea terrae]|uniref:hypothetical protein n=1 Tax=Lentzea terrae TaxID=2200761 RepID=UPI00130083C2|nr:hypothetical protein [Lentzea terrae]